MANNYEILQLEDYADAEKVKLAYRRLAKLYHPDVSDDPNADYKFKRIQLAYSVLSHPGHKRSYDQTLKEREDMDAYKEQFVRRYESGYYHPRNRLKSIKYFITVGLMLLAILCFAGVIIYVLASVCAYLVSRYLFFP